MPRRRVPVLRQATRPALAIAVTAWALLPFSPLDCWTTTSHGIPYPPGRSASARQPISRRQNPSGQSISAIAR